ncbi:MAG: hypothetical protein WCI18_08470 [Pseudomonadota bacterium]
MKIKKSGQRTFFRLFAFLVLGATIFSQMGAANAAPNERLNREQLFSCKVLVDDGMSSREEFRSIVLAQDSRDASYQCRQTTYSQCLDLADRIFSRNRVSCEGPFVSQLAGGGRDSDSDRSIDTFCRRSPVSSNTELTLVRGGRLGEVILETTFESQCNSARAQLKQNGRCFCGKPASSTNTSLICLTRQGQVQDFGTFTFESQCQESLRQILEGR